MKFKIFLFLSILSSSLALTACSSGSDKDEEFPPTMTGVVLINNQEYDMKPGGYRWTKESGFGTQYITTDAASPNQIAEELSAIPMKAGEKIILEVEDNPELSVYLWNESERLNKVPLTDNEFSSPSSEGQYIYEVLAEWSSRDLSGEVSFTFVVEVKE